MARIRGKDTKPEVLLRRALWAAGLRYRLQAKTPAGRPDIVFPNSRIAVFVDGCFWHGCPLHYARPLSREEFWAKKLAETVERDRIQTSILEQHGWTVIRVWEHAVFSDLGAVTQRIRALAAGAPDTIREDWRVVRVEVTDRAARLEARFLQNLANPSETRTESGPRVTAKWKGRRTLP